MDKWYIIQFAAKSLFSHRLRTTLTLLAITIGISAIVFLISFAYGIEKIVSEEVTGGDAFKLIDVGTGNSQLVKLDEDSISSFVGLGDVDGVETTTNLAAKANYENKSMDFTLSVTSNKYMEWSGLSIRWGDKLNDQNLSNMIVNEAFAEYLGVSQAQEILGKEISINMLVPKELTDKDEVLQISDQKFHIAGVIQSTNSPTAYVLQNNLANYGVVYFTQCKVEVGDNSKVVEVRKKIEAMGFKTQYVGDTITQIEQIFNVFKVILGSFGLIALVVASLGMFNTLTISLLERMKEVALLKILGARKRDISRLFITEALIFGLIGGVSGILFGCLGGSIANSLLNVYATNNGGDPVRLFYYPFWFLFFVFIFSLLVGLLTGMYPARRASRVASLDVIRYE